MDCIRPKTVVEHEARRGVTCPDLMSCCEPDETPVVFAGTTVFEGVLTEALVVVGPENAVADAHKCGAGQGAECCRFLALAPEGFCCERFGEFRWMLIMRGDTMNARREPDALYPDCMIFEPKAPHNA